MTKKLHTRTKIFFPDPHVVRLEYDSDVLYNDAIGNYRKITRNAFKLIQGTWGYTTLEGEPDNRGEISPIMQVQAPAALNWPAVFPGAIYNPIYTGMIMRGYVCFKDPLDLMQFRLSVEPRAIQVKMWPSRWFTIHETIETDEV